MLEDKPTGLGELEREFTLIAWGVLLGFGYLTGWKAYKQTSAAPKGRRYRSRYFWWVWVGFFAIISYGCLSWLLILERVKPGLVA